MTGSDNAQRTQRHYGLSDRIRYLWPEPAANEAVERLMERLAGSEIPWPLISQYLARLADPVAQGKLQPIARDLLIGAVRQALAPYTNACEGG